MLRLVSRAQRIASAAKWCAADPGPFTVRGDPGSAAHRSALTRSTLHRIRDTLA